MHQNVYAFAFPFFLFLLYFPSFKIEILEHTQKKWQKLHDFYLCYFFFFFGYYLYPIAFDTPFNSIPR